MQVVDSNGKFRVQLQNGVLNKWKYNEDTGLWDKTNICDTKVDDIPKTDVVFTSGKRDGFPFFLIIRHTPQYALIYVRDTVF